MRNRFTFQGAAWAISLCLTLSFLFTATVQAQELKPFLTLKVADPATLMSVAEKIADLTGQRRDFDAGVASFKDLKGLNRKGPFGLVLQTDGEEIKNPLFVLPIEKLEDVDLPNFEALMASAKKEGDGKYVINSPVGQYNMYQRKDHLLVTGADSEGELPGDVQKLFAGLDDYTLGLRIDLENTSRDSIDMLLAPVTLLLAMQGGQAAQSAESMSEAIETLYNECRSMTIGITFDAKTAAAEIVASTIPKKGSDSEKQLIGFKDAKTAFSGFLGSGSNVVFSVGGVDSNTKATKDTTMATIDQVIDGLLEQAEDQAETDEDFEFAENVAESIRTIIEATLDKGKSDLACSLDGNGTFLLATTIGDTDELKKLAKACFEHFKKMHDAEEADNVAEKYFKKEYKTVEGFVLSSFVLPLVDTNDPKIPSTLADKTISVYWGLKENDAIAVAFGFDPVETEKCFIEALNKTETPVAVRQPTAIFAFQPLGKLLDQYVPKETKDSTMEKVVDLLSAATSDAKITYSIKVDGEVLEGKLSASGSAVQVLMNLYRIFTAADSAGTIDSTKIREF